MRRDRMRTVVAVMVIAAMVLLAVGAVGSLLGGAADDPTRARTDAGPAVSAPAAPRALGA